jgi:hypothetical protein
METEEQEYLNAYLRMASAVERWLIRCLRVLLALLVAAQCLLRIPEVRHAVSRVDQLEGSPYRYQAATDEKNGQSGR